MFYIGGEYPGLYYPPLIAVTIPGEIFDFECAMQRVVDGLECSIDREVEFAVDLLDEPFDMDVDR